MLLYFDTLIWFWANQSLIILLNAECLAEKQQRLKSMIYHTWDKYANHCMQSERNREQFFSYIMVRTSYISMKWWYYIYLDDSIVSVFIILRWFWAHIQFFYWYLDPHFSACICNSKNPNEDKGLFLFWVVIIELKISL